LRITDGGSIYQFIIYSSVNDNIENILLDSVYLGNVSDDDEVAQIKNIQFKISLPLNVSKYLLLPVNQNANGLNC